VSLGSVILFLAALPASLPRPAAQSVWPEGEVRKATLSFDGKSSLGDFTGVTTSVRGHMTGGAALADVRGWVEAPVSTLKTANDRRDRDLVKTMEAATYPNIRFELTGVQPVWERGDSAEVTLQGNFVIHGVTRAESVKASVVRDSSGIRIMATLPMNLHDYQINKLTRFLVFKMKPDIVVHVDVTFWAGEGRLDSFHQPAPPPGFDRR
jgi:polyisoprenoid-binding protein YceI